MHKYLAFLVILFSMSGKAQPSSDTKAGVEVKTRNWDTLKYHKYDYAIIIGIYQQFRNFNNEFELLHVKDTNLAKHTLAAESQLVSGISINYDKFSFSFGTSSAPQSGSSGKGSTNMFNIGFNIGDNTYTLENYYRRFTGFYNKNTPNYDTTFKHTGQYDLQPDLMSSLLMSRFMYFTNYKKFSFKSGFGCNYRQLKSAASWILGGSFNKYDLKNSGPIFPIQTDSLQNDYASLNAFHSINIGFNAGAAATLVIFKAWFINGYFTVGPEQQWRSYVLAGHERNLSYVSWSGTGRISIGLNLKRFYFLFSSANDYNLFNNSALKFKSNALTHNFSIGWRFHTGTPKFYRKFQQTKIYKLF